MRATTIPSTVTKLSIRGLRLPLSAVEVVARRAGADTGTWPPAVAFETFEVGAKQAIGTALHDDELVREAELQQAKLAELRRAAQLEVEAQQTRRQAEAAARERSREAAEQRQQIEKAAERERQEIEARKAERARRADQTVQRQEKAVRTVQQGRAKAVEAAKRRARGTELREETEAVERQRQALDATAEVIELDRAVEDKQQQRRSS